MKVPSVSELMTETTVSLRSDRTLEEAEQALRETGLSALPVMSPTGNWIGVMTDFQLVKCFLKRNQSPAMIFVGNYAGELDPIQTIDEGEPISLAFRSLVQSASRRVYVTREGKLCGVIASPNLFGFLVQRSAKKSAFAPKPAPVKPAPPPPDALLNEMFKYSPCTFHSLDLAGKIVAANPMIHLMLGYNQGELIGMTYKELYPTTVHQEVEDGMMRLRETGFFPYLNTAMVKKNQELVDIDIVTMLRYDERSLPSGTVTIGHLPTELEHNALLIEVASAMRVPIASEPQV